MKKSLILVVLMTFSLFSLMAETQVEINEHLGIETDTHQTTVGQRTLRDIPEGGLLLIPESTNKRVMAFDPINGDLIDANFIPADPVNLATPIEAGLHPDGNSILVSDQIKDGLIQYDLNGNFMGWFAPAGGQNNTILDNVRGWGLKADGSILVTNNGTATNNPDCVAQFDALGNYVGNFIANGSGGLDSPFDVIYRPNFDDYLVTTSTSNAAHQYDNAGNYLGNLITGINFLEQICETPSGNLLVAGFSTPSGVYEYTSNGTYVGYYGLYTGLRGVYELGNGNILLTNGNGVYEINRNNTLVSVKIEGVSGRFITFVEGDGGTTLNPPENLQVDNTGYATWDAPTVGGPIQVNPQAVPYWTGSTDGTTLTYNSMVRGWDLEDGWMKFDVSSIPDGSTITEIQFNGYVNATYFPYWEINGVYVDPLTTPPATLFSAITNSANQYNYFTEPSTFAPGWKVDILGGNANADLAAALSQDWFCLGINSTDDYATYYIVFDGWNETNPPFLMVTYEGTDGRVATTKAGAISGSKHAAADNTRDLLGYNVYLDGVFVTFTTNLSHQYTGLTAGQQYLAEVTAFYDEGESDPIDYLFTYDPTNPIINVNPTAIAVNVTPDEIVTVPITISNTGTGDLVFNITVDLNTEDGIRSGETIKRLPVAFDAASSERNPDLRKSESSAITDDLFDVLFQYPVGVGSGEYGIATDGQFVYTSKWNATASTYHKYDMNFNYISDISVPGAMNVRDLAYDGQYFYGAPNTTAIYQMDFTNQTLVATITAPAAVRAIAYDAVNDGFWVSNGWNPPLRLLSRSGTVLQTLNTTATSFAGLAWENVSDGTPYLWAYTQSGSGNLLEKIDITTGATLQSFDVSTVVTFAAGSIAGGLEITDQVVPGTWAFLGTDQNDVIWGLELCPGDEPWLSANPLTGTVPAGGSVQVTVTLDATDLVNVVMNGALHITSNGGNVDVPVTMTVGGGGYFAPPENVSVNGETGLVTWTPPPTVLIYDNFESYNVGDYLAQVSPLWTTWTNQPGGAEDAQISNDHALSGDKSVKITGASDMVLIMNNYTSGVYAMDLNLYIPTGNCGYFNLQKTTTPGQEWAFQIQFDATGIATADAGAAGALTFPFNFNTWINMKLVVNLNTDNCQVWVDGVMMHSYQWTLGTFGTPGLLSFGGVNLYAWASAGNTPLCYFDDIKLIEIVPATEDLTGYNVYLDNVFQGYTTALEYQLDGLVNGTQYTAGVSAVYDDPGESEIVPYTFTYTPVTTFLPPNNVLATVQTYNDVLVTWEPPGGATDEIYYHSGYDNNGIGTNGVASWICAARFTADELAAFYGGWAITGVNIFLHSMDFSAVGIRVYQGGSFGNPGTLVYEQDITTAAVALAFTNHVLTTPIPLVAGNEYWLGYSMDATGDHPAAVDSGPAVAGKGDWMYFSGVWQEISVAFSLNYNWVITGVVTQSDAVASGKPLKTALIGNDRFQSREKSFGTATPEAAFRRTVRRDVQVADNRSRSLAGFKVYRDGAMVHEITNPGILQWLDTGVAPGNHSYYVTGVYTNPNGESDPSNTSAVNIVLPQVINVNAVSNGANIVVTWGALERALESYNIYRDGALVGTVTSNLFVNMNVPAGTYVYNVAGVFTGSYEGPWSADFLIEHTDADPNLIPLVTSLDGNYPNPFNPTTTIKFGLHEVQVVSLNVYNIKGEKVRTLVSGELEAGYHSIVWDGRDESGKPAASGVYFYKMKADKFLQTKKMILMK